MYKLSKRSKNSPKHNQEKVIKRINALLLLLVILFIVLVLIAMLLSYTDVKLARTIFIIAVICIVIAYAIFNSNNL